MDCERLIEYVIRLIKTEPIDYVCFLGDLLHSHEKLYTTPMNTMLRFIRDVSKLVPVYVLVGNHDMENNSCFLSDSHWMMALHEWDNVTICDSVVELKLEGGNIVFCPYIPNGRFEEALDTNPDWHNATAIFAHQEIKGCKMGSIVSADGDKWETFYPLLISGHIHERQSPQENVFYTGSSLQHAFSSNDPKAVFIFEFFTESGIELPNTSGFYSFIEYPLNVTQKKTHNYNVDAILKVKNVERFCPSIAEVNSDTEGNSNNEENSDAQRPVMHKIVVKDAPEKIAAFKRSKKYKELLKTGASIVFKAVHKKVDVEVNEKEKEKDGRVNLMKLLDRLILESGSEKEIESLNREVLRFRQV